MDKRKKSYDYKNDLPPPPDPPKGSSGSLTSTPFSAGSATTSTAAPATSQPSPLPDSIARLYTFKEREMLFLKSLNDTIKSENQNSDINIENSDNSDLLATECYDYINPLLNRSGSSIAAALSTLGAVDQLDRLHNLMNQLLTLQEQNMRMQRAAKNLEAITAIKNMEQQIHKDPEAFILNNSYDEYSDSDLIDAEFEQNLALLEAIGKSASSKRTSGKRLRSKSVINDDITNRPGAKVSVEKNYPLRRQSAVTDFKFKPKVSKWTKVKAAFKWEKANALNESKSAESILTPINTEVARYLRVPAPQCVGSSGDSIMSSSSGHFIASCSGPGTPADMSSASSTEDICDLTKDEFIKKESFNREREREREQQPHRNQEDEQLNLQKQHRQQQQPQQPQQHQQQQRVYENDSSTAQTDKNKNKSAWSKVKGIVKTHRGSLKSNSRSRGSKTSTSLGCSREGSPCDSVDAFSNEYQRERSDSFSSNQTSPTLRNQTPTFILTQPASGDGNTSGASTSAQALAIDDVVLDFGKETKCDIKYGRSGSYSNRNSRKSKHIPEIESLPEGIPLESMPSSIIHKRSPPSPLYFKQDSSDPELNESLSSPSSYRDTPKHFPIRKGSTFAGDSLPNSPSRNYEFEFESEDLSSGDFSEPITPQRQLSARSKHILQRDEIKRRYQELQRALHQEFEVKKIEWDRMRPATVALNSNPIHNLFKEESLASGNKSSSSASSSVAVVTEENLPPDFKKKLNEWRTKKQQSISKETTPTSKDSDSKRKATDWQLWKLGQVKLEGQGIKTLPDAKDLPEDFQKKLNEWKQMKSANKIPSYSTQTSYSSTGGKSSQSKSLASTSGTSFKKSRTADDIEKDGSKSKSKSESLLKLKALVADPPKKEVVVKTTKGFMKFEGISRKFTRKLYEWEKARGIGPEASSFALLHPGYRPVVVENGEASTSDRKREKSPGITRSMSVDSIAPNPSVPTITHQPSSLSLNDADEFKSNASISERRVSSNPELETSNQNNQDEPEAVIVEVEDDIVETTDTFTLTQPVFIEKQNAVCKYERMQKRMCTLKTEPVIMQDSTKIDNTINTITKFDQLMKVLPDRTLGSSEIQHILKTLGEITELFPTLLKIYKTEANEKLNYLNLMKQETAETMKLLNRLHEKKDNDVLLQMNITIVNNNLCELKQFYNRFKSTSNNPKINVIQDNAAVAVESVQEAICEMAYQNMAIINMSPVIFNSITPISSDTDCLPNTSVSQDSSNYFENIRNEVLEECERVEPNSQENGSNGDGKKLQRNSSNSSRRKTRIRRMGSRQNSKTESDSDDNSVNYVLDAPRKAKRKTSRAKQKTPPDCVNVEASRPIIDDVVYILKIRPGQKLEQTEIKARNDDILISPTETCFELMDNATTGSNNNVSNSNNSINTADTFENVLIKTKRTIFSPVQSKFDGSTTTVIGQEISDPTPPDNACDNLYQDSKLVTNLPPLPQSPRTQRRLEQQSSMPILKELSPSIRIMIDKYNQNVITTNRATNSPHSSGSASPVIWRSPVMERRMVKTQTEKYQENNFLPAKSASVGCLRNRVNKLKNPSIVKGVLKSSSDGVLQIESENCLAVAANNTTEVAKENRERSTDTEVNEKTGGKRERMYRKRLESQAMANRSGAIRKIALGENKLNNSTKYLRSKSCPSETNMKNAVLDRSENTPPKIIRKYDASKSPQLADEAFACASINSDDSSALLSQRALKIRQAKEEFLQMGSSPSRNSSDTAISKSNRMSQISTVSGSSMEDSDISIVKSASAGLLNTVPPEIRITPEPGYDSLPRDTGASEIRGRALKNSNNNEYQQQGGSRFALSSLASKLRKVKLRRSNRDLSKMHTVSELCRRSLMVDITMDQENISAAEMSDQGTSSSRLKPRSKKDEIKKTKSLGFLQNE